MASDGSLVVMSTTILPAGSRPARRRKRNRLADVGRVADQVKDPSVADATALGPSAPVGAGGQERLGLRPGTVENRGGQTRRG